MWCLHTVHEPFHLYSLLNAFTSTFRWRGCLNTLTMWPKFPFSEGLDISWRILVSSVVLFLPLVAKQDNCGSVASFLRSAASGSGLPRDLDDVTIPDFPDVSCFALAGGQGCDVGSAPAPSACIWLLFLWFLPFFALESWFHSCRCVGGSFACEHAKDLFPSVCF